MLDGVKKSSTKCKICVPEVTNNQQKPVFYPGFHAPCSHSASLREAPSDKGRCICLHLQREKKEQLKTGGSNKSVKRVAAVREQKDCQRSCISLLLKGTLVISASEIWKTT